jgi:mRNA-degrading endonuclease RelE of RelBE toxin-antitoxin system
MFEVVLAPSAVVSFGALPVRIRAKVRDAIERHLRHEPTRTSKSRIKRLRGLSHPQYRLRVDDIRVYYDITEETVEILGILSKAESQVWLEAEGSPTD